MKTVLISAILMWLSSQAFANESLSVKYELPIPAEKETAEILAVPIQIFQISTHSLGPVATEFGNRIYKPFVSVIDRELSQHDGSLLVKKEDEIQVELKNLNSPWIYVQLTGVQVFFQERSNFLERVKINGATNHEIKIPLSVVEFDQEEGNWEWIRYNFFMSIRNIPPIFESDIRTRLGLSLKEYMNKFTRHDNSWGLDEVPQPGLKTDNFNVSDAYVFSSCIEFRNRRISNTARREGDCYVYPLSERESLLPIIGNRKLRGTQSPEGLYLVERERKERNSDRIHRSWTKISLPSKTFVSLDSANWRDF